jgi:hypothetical protein
MELAGIDRAAANAREKQKRLADSDTPRSTPP